MSDSKTTMTLTGQPLAPGLGKGQTFVYRDDLTQFDAFYAIEDCQVEEELERLERALVRISDDLRNLAGRVEKEIHSELSEIFHAHAIMVQDPSLKAEVQKEIREELVSAGSAARTVFHRWECRFRSMEAQVARQKGDDVRDLARRVVAALAGVRAHALEDMPHGNVLVATRLLPSDTVCLVRRGAAAAILEAGGATSHAALFAHEIGLPCVSGIPRATDAVPHGLLALVDADLGEVVVNPTLRQERGFEAKRRKREETDQRARSHTHEPAVTLDGQAIHVLANVGTEEDSQAAIDNGADGIGLYRIELAYLAREAPPDAGELAEALRKTLQPAKGLPVCVRLLDVGADKPLPSMEQRREPNPSLGCRGVRFLLEWPELLRTQLEALLNLSSDWDLHVLVPMVTLPSDMLGVRQFLTDAASRIGTASIPKLGAMIETPSAALAAGDIAQHADFLSVGTNDLTQYTFAADRENAAVDAYFDDTHKVIFRLLRTIRDEAPHLPLSLCGELATRTEAVADILRSGVTSLSVAPPTIPAVKEAIRGCGVGVARCQQAHAER